MTKPQDLPAIQQTRQFTSARGAMNYLLKLRQRFGTHAKCFLRNTADGSYLKYKVPDDGRPLPNSGTVVSESERIWN